MEINTIDYLINRTKELQDLLDNIRMEAKKVFEDGSINFRENEYERIEIPLNNAIKQAKYALQDYKALNSIKEK